MVKNTLPAMAYIEIGNIKNEQDRKRILEPENRQALANWITQGIILDRGSDDASNNLGQLTEADFVE